MRLILLGDCAFGLGPFHQHTGNPVLINFAFMRAKIDSVGSLAGGVAGIMTHETRIVAMVGASNALRAGTRGMAPDDFYREVTEDFIYLIGQFSWWGILDRLVLSRCLPVNDLRCRESGNLISNGLLGVVNRVIREKGADFNLRILDLSEGLADEDGQLVALLTTDGLHLNEEGYRVMKGNLYDAFFLNQ